MNIQGTKAYIEGLARAAKDASYSVGKASSKIKDDALNKMADAIVASADFLKEENEKDFRAGEEAGLSSAMLDRLTLTDSRIESMADGLRTMANLKDPVGEIIEGWTRPNGLRIQKVRVPIGVVCIIYESRPNVTADAAGLCLKAGNATILRGGKDAICSNLAIHKILASALISAGLDKSCLQMVETTSRAAVEYLATSNGLVDVIIPRGGESLIRAVTEKATIPVIKHFQGICHTYIDKDADLDMAEQIAVNAKVQRPGVCNAMETMLVHEAVAAEFLPRVSAKMREACVELRGCKASREIVDDMKEATKEDWTTEYLDLILSVRIVPSIDDAIHHINNHGSAHSDAIITNNLKHAERFTNEVNSATVYVNASTRFTDGGEFGMGAEIGISTDKLHARGPMGLVELTSYKSVILGDGQVRE